MGIVQGGKGMNTYRRLEDDKDGNMFFPRTLDGGSNGDKFFTGPKMIITIADVLFVGFLCFDMILGYANLLFKIIYCAVMIHLGFALIRYFVFEERYYYAMYKKRKEFEKSTPRLFWDIIRKVDIDDVCVVTFSNLSMGVYVKLIRGCTIGKDEDFEELNYDAISDFYNALVMKDLKYKFADVMHTASKDERVTELDHLVRGSEFNSNLNLLTQLKVGHLKKYTRQSVVEEEFILIYTDDVDKLAEDLVTEVYDCLYCLLDGGYTGFRIFDQEDIDDFVCARFGVKLFDSMSASLEIYGQSNKKEAFEIEEIGYIDGTIKKKKDIDKEEKAKELARLKASESNNRKNNKKELSKDKLEKLNRVSKALVKKDSKKNIVSNREKEEDEEIKSTNIAEEEYVQDTEHSKEEELKLDYDDAEIGITEELIDEIIREGNGKETE